MKSKSINTNALLYNGMNGAQLKSLKLSGNSTVDMPNGTLKGNQIVNAEYIAGVEEKLSEEIAKTDKDLNTSILATKDELRENLSSLERKLEEMGAYVFKGSCTYEELPRTASVGDVYNVTNEHNNVPAGTNYAWTGEYWDELGGIVDIDLSNYYTKEEVDKDISDIESKVTDSENRLTNKIDDINSLLVDKSDELSELSDKLDGEIIRSKEAEELLQTNIDTKQDKLPQGQSGQILTKTTDGTEWKTLNIENGSGYNSLQQKSCKATGYQSFAEGINTIANSGHAEGDNSTSSGSGVHAEGCYTSASSYGAHSEGNHTSASGNSSHAEGSYTEATNSFEHAEGAYNKSNKASNNFGDAGNTLSSIGNGMNDDTRKNVQEVMQNGDFYIIGVGEYNGTNPYESQTLQEVINNKISSPPGEPGQVLFKTDDGEEWGDIKLLPDDGSIGDYLVKSDDGVEFKPFDVSDLPKIDQSVSNGLIPISDGERTYVATPEQINLMLQHQNLPELNSISGSEQVAVVKNGISYLASLTQIRQVVLPGYTYEDLTPDIFDELEGGITSTDLFITNRYKRIEIPIKEQNQIFVLTISNANCDSPIALRFGFTSESLIGYENNQKINFISINNNEEGSSYQAEKNKPYTVMSPIGAKYLILNLYVPYQSYMSKITWKIESGILITTERLNELSNRVSMLEQSAISPMSEDSVSREEFDSLKQQLEELKSKI